MTSVLTDTVLLPESELEELLSDSREARLECPSGALPLKEVTAETLIEGLIATTKYRQVFVNPTSGHLEVTYIFPLPSRAGVSDFVAILGGRRIDGILKERGEARAEYAQALAESKRAALVETDRADVFSAKLGNIAPGEEAIIELVVTGPVAVEDGEATFRFPLVTAPRYISGEALGVEPSGSGEGADTDAVPDATRLNPPRLNDFQDRPVLSFVVKVLHPGLSGKSFRSSHPMSIEEGGDKTKKGVKSVSLTLGAGEKMDSDLLVRFDLPKELVTQAIFVDDPGSAKSGAKEKTGTWALSLVAPQVESTTPRDIVMVMDRSGSMRGWKMVAARRAMARLIDSLSPADRFAVVAFDDKMDVFRPARVGEEGADAPFVQARETRVKSGLSEADMYEGSDRNRFSAVSWVSALEARGGTEMRRPVVEAVELLARSPKEREPVVVLVTDGQMGAEAQLLSALESKVGRTRFCVVGIDKALNTGLLERLGRRTNGYVSFVESEDRLDAALVNLHRRIGRPALVSLAVSLSGAELLEGENAPRGVVDVFAGVPCLVTGRYARGTETPVVHVSATLADGSGNYEATLAATKSTTRGIQTSWARARIADLEDAYDSGRGEQGALRAKIVAFSLAQKVLSRFSAFVAVDTETQEIASSGEAVQPVESPEGWDMAGASFMAMSASAPVGTRSALRSFTGRVGSSGLLRGSVASSDMGNWSTSDVRAGTGTALDAFRAPKGPFGRSKNVSIEILEECLVRLGRASDTKVAPIADLVRRLRASAAGDPYVLTALVALSGYMASTTTLADAKKAVEESLRSLRSQGQGQSPLNVRDRRGASSREFWS
jgi:Mg-chelatase subunit ChlD